MTFIYLGLYLFSLIIYTGGPWCSSWVGLQWYLSLVKNAFPYCLGLYVNGLVHGCPTRLQFLVFLISGLHIGIEGCLDILVVLFVIVSLIHSLKFKLSTIFCNVSGQKSKCKM